MIYNELIERGTEHFSIELYQLDKNHSQYEMSAHWHKDIELIRIISGELKIKLNSNEYIAKPNDIIFVNPETVHSASPTDECIYECIVMNINMLNTEDEDCRFFIDALINNELYVNEFNHDAPTKFSECINYLFDSMKKKSSGYKFCVISALYNLFGAIIDNNLYTYVSSKEKLPVKKNLPKLKKVLAYIRENYDKQITLEDISNRADMSQKYFCSFFKELTIKTPIEYLILYRVECAARKLLNSDMEITDIAYSCGFNDLSYFIKTFKRLKGFTPLKFRHQQGKS